MPFTNLLCLASIIAALLVLRENDINTNAPFYRIIILDVLAVANFWYFSFYVNTGIPSFGGLLN
jgi:hypothetical protein